MSTFTPVRCWNLRTRRLVAGRLPLVMGIVNVTPDSFSDGGQFLRNAGAASSAADEQRPYSARFDPAAAVDHGLRLAAEGADLLDVGGESTRPGAAPVNAQEELRRVLPVVAGLVKQTAVPVSIDTSKAVVARAALDAGAEAINDVTALRADSAMRPLAVETGCGVCAMHMRGTPPTMQQAPEYADVVEEVLQFLRAHRDALVAAGVDQARIALDPGIGFGKTTAHNLALLANIGRFHALGCPLVVGHSRKRFIGEVLGDPAADRTAGTVGVACALARQGVQVLRVHDVAAVRQGLVLFGAAEGCYEGTVGAVSLLSPA